MPTCWLNQQNLVRTMFPLAKTRVTDTDAANIINFLQNMGATLLCCCATPNNCIQSSFCCCYLEIQIHQCRIHRSSSVFTGAVWTIRLRLQLLGRTPLPLHWLSANYPTDTNHNLLLEEIETILYSHPQNALIFPNKTSSQSTNILILALHCRHFPSWISCNFHTRTKQQAPLWLGYQRFVFPPLKHE